MFASSIFPTTAVHDVTTGILSAITSNMAAILGVFAFIVGLSIVMAWLDVRRENKMLDSYAASWRRK
jgi:hypothetical protein